MIKEKDKRKQKVKILMFLAFSLAFTLPNFAQYQMSPLAARIMEQYSLTNGQFTSIFTAPMILAVFFCFISGILTDKFGFKTVVGIFVVISGIGGILRVFANSYVTLYISMALVGVSAGIVVSNAAKIIGSVFDPKKVGVIVSMAVAIGTGMMIVAMSTTALMPTTRSAFILAACLGVASVILWITGVPKRRNRGKEEVSTLPSIRTCLKTVLSNKYVWIAAIGNFCLSSAMIGLNSLISAALVSRGMSEASAGVVSSINIIGNLVGSLVMPIVAHKTGKLRLVLFINSIVAAVGTAFSWLAPVGLPLYAALFLTGMGVGGVLPQLIAINIKLPGIGPMYAGTAGGFIATLQLLGSIILPTYVAAPIAGGSFYLYFIIVGAFTLICAVMMTLLPKAVDG